jgi:alpha-D-ribose 1-methylphosphonate 5-triphosphate synthase subunit PhnG
MVRTATTDGGEAGQEAGRRRLMAALALAELSALEAAWAEIQPPPGFKSVRGPETGLVMIRGRIGGGGAPFNLGEATVSRATVRLDSGEIGFGQTLGIAPRKAELAALLDALAQRPDHAARIADLVDCILSQVADNDAVHRRRTAATRVDFFTMVRGED